MSTTSSTCNSKNIIEVANMSTSKTSFDAQFGAVLHILIRYNWIHVDVVEAIAAVNKTLQSLVKRQKLQRLAVRLNGFSTESRIRYWLRAGDVKTLMSELVSDQMSSRDLYLKVAGITSFEDRATFQTGIEGEISRDVERTFAADPYFSDKDDGRRLLGNVLKAVAVYANDIGYCQGMNYVVASLLLVMNDAHKDTEMTFDGLSVQEAAFWVTLSLIRRKGMADLWKHKMPGLSQCIYLFQQLLRLHLYDLSTHFRQIGMHSSILVTQWFVTIFARVLTTQVLVRIWDLFFTDGWKAVYRVALAITQKLRPKLLALDLEQCSEYFRKNPKLGLEKSFSCEDLLQCALKYKVTRSSLKQLEEERHFEYLRLRLQQTPLSEEHRMLFPALGGDVDAQQKSFNLIRLKLRRFDTDVASDTVFLQHKIEVAEKAHAQAMSVRYAIAYELSEAAIELNERIEVKNRLRSKFCKLMATAMTEAASVSIRSSRSSFTSWINPLEFVNERIASCFERLPLLSSLTENVGVIHGSDNDTDDEENEEVKQNLKHLDILVPRLAAELRLIQRSLTYNRRFLRPLLQRTRRLQRDAQLEVEEAQLFKDRLADQLLQIMLTCEKLKNERMQQLFAEVDEQHI